MNALMIARVSEQLESIEPIWIEESATKMVENNNRH